MGVTDSLRRFGFTRPKAFAIAGWGGEAPLRTFAGSNMVVWARAPHDSDLLVLSGDIPETWDAALRALFETIALPRLAVWLRPDRAAPAPRGLPLIELDAERPDREALMQRLLDPDAANNRPILADEPPAPWRGEGDHGQGGKGMMGGKPYGRPMAMTGSDPDGLMLGELPTSLGPFFPGLPTGLQIKLSLQGDRIASVEAVVNWFPDQPAAAASEVPKADIERERIQRHLRIMAAMLDLAGLSGLARRYRNADTAEPRRLERLFRAAERRWLRHALHGIGRIDRDQAERLGLEGPVARASGLARDARDNDPAYRGLGFAPVTADGGDAWARWKVLRDECLQSAALIPSLGGRTTRSAATSTTNASRANLAAVEHILPGLLWPDALLAVASLGLDMQEAALT